MRIGTYFGFAAGLAAGACLIGLSPKAKQVMEEVKEKAVQKIEETATDCGSTDTMA